MADLPEPQRIQLKRTKGWRMPPDTIKVDRSTRWGNPYRAAQHDRKWAVEMFELGLADGRLDFTPEHVRQSLAGFNLACWCPPNAACHADVLLRVANEGQDA